MIMENFSVMIMEEKKKAGAKLQEWQSISDTWWQASVGPFHYVPEGMKIWHDTLKFVFLNRP